MERAPGQISLWDIKITESNKKPKSFTKTVEKATKIVDSFTVLEKYKIRENLSRIVQYCGGGYGIELQLEENFKTIYVNKEGKEEFTKDKRLPVLPMDKILFYREDLQPNSSQEERLHDLKVKYPMAKIIKRRGDNNVILILEDKVISITPKWVLEFYGIKVVYEENEILQDHKEVIDIEDMQRKVRPGDLVQAKYGPALIEGIITREYGLANEILNISFDNDTRCTAIGRSFVTKILKAA